MEEFLRLHNVLRISFEEMVRPLAFEETIKLPKKPMVVDEYFLYVEQMIRRYIQALQQIPLFRNLSVANKVKLLKVLSNSLLNSKQASYGNGLRGRHNTAQQREINMPHGAAK